MQEIDNGYHKALQSVGRRIRSLRESHEMSIYDLATKVGVDETEIANIEAGLKNFTYGFLLDISDALGIDAKEFFNY